MITRTLAHDFPSGAARAGERGTLSPKARKHNQMKKRKDRPPVAPHERDAPRLCEGADPHTLADKAAAGAMVGCRTMVYSVGGKSFVLHELHVVPRRWQRDFF